MEKGIENTVLLSEEFDLICLSHLRWDFVYQRPQHLLSRFAKNRRVFFFEEPIFIDGDTHLKISLRENNLSVVVPHISHADRDNKNVVDVQRELLDDLFNSQEINNFVLWFYTPMAINFAAHLEPQATVFDCMDELSAFKFAPPELIENERRLFKKADLVFTGGQSLYEAKKHQHKQVFAFPSSIDAEHFKQARTITEERAEQKSIPRPRFGYYGVIDERIDIRLLAEIADLRPDWQFVMVGPVVKISDEDLPRRENIHYLGGKSYQDLPAFLADWDVAIMPFAINESTRFISPTKTPEYLAAGKPVVSTPIRDVVRPYGEMNLVHIASTAEEFVAAGEKALQENDAKKLLEIDEFLAQMSWDKTWQQMNGLIDEVVRKQVKSSTA
ncbi:MAG TPA: glycosyltransferase family 1 protein [Pyrinomonadaceae bacterium]|nr:glycosyltransferase family 1 protein [Pyrinomonadaceae bacterium]